MRKFNLKTEISTRKTEKSQTPLTLIFLEQIIFGIDRKAIKQAYLSHQIDIRDINIYGAPVPNFSRVEGMFYYTINSILYTLNINVQTLLTVNTPNFNNILYLITLTFYIILFIIATIYRRIVLED